MADINDPSNDVSLHDETTHDAVTTTKTGTAPEEKTNLDVYIQNPSLTLESGAKIRYDEMSNNQAIANGSYTTVYTNTTPGKVYTIYMSVNNSGVDLRVIIDGTNIIDGINLDDLNSNYGLAIDSYNQLPRGLYVSNNGRAISIEFPEAASYGTSLVVALRGTAANRELVRGLVIRAEN